MHSYCAFIVFIYKSKLQKQGVQLYGELIYIKSTFFPSLLRSCRFSIMSKRCEDPEPTSNLMMIRWIVRQWISHGNSVGEWKKNSASEDSNLTYRIIERIINLAPTEKRRTINEKMINTKLKKDNNKWWSMKVYHTWVMSLAIDYIVNQSCL